MGSLCPDHLTAALRSRFLETASPKGLGYIFPVSCSDGDSRGINGVVLPGLVDRVCYGWIGNSPAIVQLAQQGVLNAWNLPLGQIAHMIRDVAAGRAGPVTKVGMGTFVDPRKAGGRIKRLETGKRSAAGAPNASKASSDSLALTPSAAPLCPRKASRRERRAALMQSRDPFGDEEFVRLVSLGGEEALWYRAPASIQVALLRGTSADENGNISFEKEALVMDVFDAAAAVHNSGGIVIVQVERVVQAGTLSPHSVIIPGVLVDHIVISPPERQPQVMPRVPPGQAATTAPPSALPLPSLVPYDPSLTGEVRAASAHLPTLHPGIRRILAKRAHMEVGGGRSLVNLGVGAPEGVAIIAATRSGSPSAPNDALTLSTEAGAFGGTPMSGAAFGTSRNPEARVSAPDMLDVYNGGGIDVAVLGMAEVDQRGDVNVSNFGARAPGCGGFIDISQNVQEVVFVGAFMGGKMDVRLVPEGAASTLQGGPSASQAELARRPVALQIVKDGTAIKFRKQVLEVTFAASAPQGPTKVLYITERAVFRRKDDKSGIELIEIAPGVDLERDILTKMEFRPDISPNLKFMDQECFS